MNYETLLKEFFQEIPECRKLYEQKASQLLFDQETGVHIVFGVLIVPYLIELINEGKKEEKLLERFFAFFEKMAKKPCLIWARGYNRKVNRRHDSSRFRERGPVLKAPIWEEPHLL